MKHVTVCYLLVLTVVLAGCGGTKHPTATAPAPLPPTLAHTWASQATQIATALAANNGCAAQRLATTLETEYVTAVNAHTLPQRFRETLGSTLNDLQSRITCTPPPAPQQPKHEHDHGHGPGHGNDQGDNG